jgi:hypothetical protein
MIAREVAKREDLTAFTWRLRAFGGHSVKVYGLGGLAKRFKASRAKQFC